MKKTLTVALTLLVATLLSSGGLLVTHATSQSTYYSNQSQQLSLGVQGGILSAGSQRWTMKGGNLLGAQFGQEVVPTGSFKYSLSSQVSGTSATGSFQMSLNGTTLDGQQLNATMSGPVVGMIASICFPNYDTPNPDGSCPSADTSAIPAFFEAAVQVSETLGTTATTSQELMLIEAPILSPWGGPVVISSSDGLISIATTYSTGRAVWSNVQLLGQLSGALGNQPVSGTLSMVSNANENFVTGSQTELGTVSFQGMSISSLNSNGIYMGSSNVPSANSYDCSALVGLPVGTCTETGLSSSGSFMMWSGYSIQGNYQISWPAPSITYAGSISATVSGSGNNNYWNN